MAGEDKIDNSLAGKTVLVTGGLGYVGFNLANEFFRAGFKVKIMDSKERPDWLLPELYAKGNVERGEDWCYALEGVDYIAHLAAYSDYKDDFSAYFTVNAAGTALLYETIAKFRFPIKKIIIASSQSVYGEGKYRCRRHGVFYPGYRPLANLKRGRWDIYCPKDLLPVEVLPSEEDDKLIPLSPYGVSKMAQEQFALNAGRELEIPTVALRFSIVHGAYPEMRLLHPGALKFFVERALRNEPMPIHEDGLQLRDFINVKDVGMAHLAVLNNSSADFQTFNVASGKKRRLWELARMVAEAVGVDFRPVYRNEFRPFTPRHWVASSKKLEALGWVSSHSLEDNVREYVEAFRRLSK